MNEAFTEDGTPLGAVSFKLWNREDQPEDAPKLSRAEKKRKRLVTPIEDKESFRWIEAQHCLIRRNTKVRGTNS